jgi:hypothetical protein
MGNGVHGDRSYPSRKIEEMEEENLLGDSRRWCLHAWPPVVSKLTGFQVSEPGVDFGLFGAVSWAGRRCRRLS